MSRKKILLALLFSAFLMSGARDTAAGTKCGGRFFNPVSDIDWRAMFPIKIGGVAVTPGEGTDTVNHFPICFCGSPVPRVGIKVSFWEPVKLDRGRKAPRMLPFARGQKASPSLLRHGGEHTGREAEQRGDRTSFLHVHHFIYPVFSVLSLFSSFGCMTQGGFDLAYMTAFDPTLEQRRTLVPAPPRNSACGKSRRAGIVRRRRRGCTAGGFGLNELFWCAGSWGSVYPHTGNNGATGDLPAVYALSAVKLLAKLHNELLAFKTTGEGSLCAAAAPQGNSEGPVQTTARLSQKHTGRSR